MFKIVLFVLIYFDSINSGDRNVANVATPMKGARKRTLDDEGLGVINK